MSVRRWAMPVLGGSVTTGLGVAINLATELKSNPWAWAAVTVLTAAGVLVGASSERLARSRQSDGSVAAVNRGATFDISGDKNRIKVNLIGPGALVAVGFVVIIAVVAGMLTGQVAAGNEGSPAPLAPPSSDEVDTKPFHVTVLEEPSGPSGFLFPTGTVPSLPAPDPPDRCGRWSAWALDKGGIRVSGTSVLFTVAALGDDAVRVHGAQLHVDREVGEASGDQITCVQGGPIPVSYLSIDLDQEKTTYRYPDNGSMQGASRPFALQIPPGGAEQVAVEAASIECYCSWYLDLLVEANGVEYPYRVDDRGKPFVTAPLQGNYAKYRFNLDGRRWEPGIG